MRGLLVLDTKPLHRKTQQPVNKGVAQTCAYGPVRVYASADLKKYNLKPRVMFYSLGCLDFKPRESILSVPERTASEAGVAGSQVICIKRSFATKGG